MDKLLNVKIKNCYDITNKVIAKYNELYVIMESYAFENIDLYEYFVEDVRKLVLKEYEIYDNLTLKDLNMCIEMLKKINYDDSLVGSRFQRKLEVLRDTRIGVKITSNDLGLNFIPNNIEFNLFNSLISLIDIEMMTKIRKKIDCIVADNYDDLKFIKLLYKRFNLTLFMQVFENNLSEMIGLFSNMNMYNVPKLNISKLLDIIGNSLKIDNDTEFNPVNMTISKLAEISVDRLVYIGFENKPEVVFDNMALIIRLELLMDLMDKKLLEDLLIYCEMSTNKDNLGINNVIKSIKSKIK